MEKYHDTYTRRLSQWRAWSMLLSALTLAACSHELDAPTPTALETGTLSASKSEVTIDITKPSDEAITFSWTTEKNTLIKYKLVLTSGAKTDTAEVPTNSIARKFTNAEFNDFMLDKLGLEIGKPATIQAMIYARVTINAKNASSNVITISAIPSQKGPAYTKLWIVGNATPKIWDIDDPDVMENDPTSIYQFKFNEVLKAGEFKIPAGTGDWNGDFYMPPVDHPDLSSTSVKFTPGGKPDNKWQIDNPGPYKILLNISSTPFIRIEAFTPYDHIYIIGDATTAGWDANNPIAMTVDPADPNLFTWTGDLTSAGGQFRFLVSTGDLNGSAFVAPAPDAGIKATQVAFAPNGTPANNFKVKAGEDGTYKVTINQLKESVSIVKQ